MDELRWEIGVQMILMGRLVKKTKKQLKWSGHLVWMVEERMAKSTDRFFCLFVFQYFVEVGMRANTQRTTRGAGEKRGRKGKDKTVGNRDMRRYMERRGMGR